MSIGELEPFEGDRMHWVWRRAENEPLRYESGFVSSAMEKEHNQQFAYFDEGFLHREAVIDNFVEVDITEDHTMEDLSGDIATALDIAEAGGIEYRELASDSFVPPYLANSFSQNAVSKLQVNLSPSHGTVHPEADFRDHEDDLRSRERNLSDVPTTVDYSGPLFAYAIDTRPTNSSDVFGDGILLELRAPINVAWEGDDPVSPLRVGTEMKNNNWTSKYTSFPGERRVLIESPDSTRGPSANTNDDEAASYISRLRTPKQWHCRLFHVPYSMDEQHAIAGQAHRDPLDHGKIWNRFGSVNWHFQQAREEVRDAWSNCGNNVVDSDRDIGNGGPFNSSNGEMSVLALT